MSLNKFNEKNNRILVDKNNVPLIYEYNTIYNKDRRNDREQTYMFAVTERYKYCLNYSFNYWNVFDLFEIVKNDMIKYPNDYNNLKEPIIFVKRLNKYRKPSFSIIGERITDHLPLIKHSILINENNYNDVFSTIYSRKTNKNYKVIYLYNGNVFNDIFENFIKANIEEVFLIKNN